MHTIFFAAPKPEGTAILLQGLARPVGFGFFNTYYPEPIGDNNESWRLKHWGVTQDIGVRAMWTEATAGLQVSAVNNTTTAALAAIARIFPTSTVHVDRDCVSAPSRRLVLPRPRGGPEILQTHWHNCKFCEKKLNKHANGQCLFGSTYFEPALSIWRTVYGNYQWQKSSMSFVSMAGNTTTTTTTSPTAAPPTPSKPTDRKKKQKKTPKRAT